MYVSRFTSAFVGKQMVLIYHLHAWWFSNLLHVLFLWVLTFWTMSIDGLWIWWNFWWISFKIGVINNFSPSCLLFSQIFFDLMDHLIHIFLLGFLMHGALVRLTFIGVSCAVILHVWCNLKLVSRIWETLKYLILERRLFYIHFVIFVLAAYHALYPFHLVIFSFEWCYI